ncbi:DUF6427 family protein [Gaetbulibacter saemankumensis]|uniref:DUF6427 family protein n=1 Tax=Gaetbulibacter saemankumensis TaxID=311208 RepID=UPI000405CE6C|nr:DUF6427 family protein [Gaetbulibacter saemankumensis]
MIASIFNKSKPLNFVIVFFITLVAFIAARQDLDLDTSYLGFFLSQLGIFLLCCITLLMVSFIITKNNLTRKNNYDVLLFGVFVLMFVHTTLDVNIIWANFFVLLALRRLMSLRSQKEVKKKLFDAAFWIAIAAMFYFWAILFFVLIIISLILYTDYNIRHWLIPFAGVATVFIIATSTSILLYNDYFSVFKSLPAVGFDFTAYNSVRLVIGIATVLSFSVWASFFYLQNIKRKKKATRATFKIIIFAVLIACLIVILTPDKTSSEFLFAFAPLAIIMTNYIETIREKWFKEAFVSILVIVPLLLLML